jgi:hypothetical protein
LIRIDIRDVVASLVNFDDSLAVRASLPTLVASELFKSEVCCDTFTIVIGGLASLAGLSFATMADQSHGAGRRAQEGAAAIAAEYSVFAGCLEFRSSSTAGYSKMRG